MIEGQESGKTVSRLKYGMVGGGQGAFIGDVHRKAIAMDGQAELVAGCFSQDFENTLATGRTQGLDEARLYPTFTEMMDAEGGREEGIDFVVIVTPNDSHYSISKAALEQGIHVVCDKPLATSSKEAEALDRLARDKDLLFCVTYAYAAYPMVKHMRAMIANGDLGDIRFVHGEYPQEWLATSLEKTGQKQSLWRTDPARAGISNCVGDIGSHIENMVSYVTGLEIERLCARLDKIGEGRVLDDNATILLDYAGGAKGVYWSSQIAIGHDNGFRIRVYGTKGAFEWVQESPNYLKVSYLDRPVQLLSRGRDHMYPRAQGLSRTPAGHPEGYFEAFANLYSTFIPALAKKIAGQEPAGDELDFPAAADGIRGVRYIERCVESSDKGAVWVSME
jgi:predicted dehydrogenase